MATIRLPLKTRRWVGLTVTVFAVTVIAAITSTLSDRLGSPSLFTGWTLFSCLILLMLLGVRRRLPFWPLGSVSTWTQVHLHLGLFTAAVYLLHAPAIIGGGKLESTLSIVFLLVTVSGFYGWFISRTFPAQLTAVPGEPRFDRMNWHRSQLASTASELANGLPDTSGDQVLKSFYHESLAAFFSQAPSLGWVLAPGRTRCDRLLGDLKSMERYLPADRRETVEQLAALIRRRHDLDRQFSMQWKLRSWVVIHSCLSLALLLAAVVHVAIALRFSH
ncbi:hypothetical protein FYK55_17570 [Roseiconus nitratireducens]|uniref:Uncharacterized protein n=1 Tax=Roseiconus nitratireducens TaxID=2605748 RepID=A0A5M6D467_9BACT|nr:hypothetical protein [Roseiconus nitratireducens]KAA5541380.1 hypothetical protein FYK55_17570 [Roseiconus nitratireducens]